jgi:hypothetical protein
MPVPKRQLPQRLKEVPWVEFRRRASTVFLMLQAGWTVLSDAEREEVRKLITKSKGRPKNLSKPEASRLGRLAAKAARAAAQAKPRS